MEETPRIAKLRLNTSYCMNGMLDGCDREPIVTTGVYQQQEAKGKIHELLRRLQAGLPRQEDYNFRTTHARLLRIAHSLKPLQVSRQSTMARSLRLLRVAIHGKLLVATPSPLVSNLHFRVQQRHLPLLRSSS